MNKQRLIVAVVSYSFEEDSSTEKGYLEGLYVDVNAVFMPGPCSKTERYNSRKESIEVEQEEERPVLHQ